MPFVETVPDEAAEGAVAEMYTADREVWGFLPNFTQLFSHRPEVYVAWRQLNGAIKQNMDPRRYELATVAAARQLHSSYCSLAHGSILLGGLLDADSLTAAMTDHRAAGLTETEVAVMDLAAKVVDDATGIEQADIDRLRSAGLDDAEIMDVVLAAAARCFFSKTLDALGVQPDAKYSELDEGVRDALTVGRPIATS